MHGLSFRLHEYVVDFDVTMNYVPGIQELHSFNDLTDDISGLMFIESEMRGLMLSHQRATIVHAPRLSIHFHEAFEVSIIAIVS